MFCYVKVLFNIIFDDIEVITFAIFVWEKLLFKSFVNFDTFSLYIPV